MSFIACIPRCNNPPEPFWAVPGAAGSLRDAPGCSQACSACSKILEDIGFFVRYAVFIYRFAIDYNSNRNKQTDYSETEPLTSVFISLGAPLMQPRFAKIFAPAECLFNQNTSGAKTLACPTGDFKYHSPPSLRSETDFLSTYNVGDLSNSNLFLRQI